MAMFSGDTSTRPWPIAVAARSAGSDGAGTEPANAACVAALLAAEFEPDQGPQVHHLHDGRTVPASWFRHDTGQPSRCRG